MIFKNKVTEEVALAELKRETANGKLGSLGVDPTSLKAVPKQGEVLRRAILNCLIFIGSLRTVPKSTELFLAVYVSSGKSVS